jgi:hypothetical protein
MTHHPLLLEQLATYRQEELRRLACARPVQWGPSGGLRLARHRVLRSQRGWDLQWLHLAWRK